MTRPSSEPRAKTPDVSLPEQSSLAARPDERRQRIADALEHCIRKEGLSATTLTAIARAARMSPSHLRYYFAGKEEIVEYYLSALSEELVREISRLNKATPDQWLSDFADYFVGNPRVTRSNIAVMIEIFGMCVHNPRLSRAKARFDGFVRGVLLDFFQWAGTAPGISPEDAAYTAWSLEIGMKFNAAFQRDFSRERARTIFYEETRRLAGL